MIRLNASCKTRPAEVTLITAVWESLYGTSTVLRAVPNHGALRPFITKSGDAHHGADFTHGVQSL